MNVIRIKKEVEKIKRVKGIIEVSKFITLQEIAKVSKTSKEALEISSISRFIFNKISKNYNLHNKFNEGGKGGKLWIYITFPKSLLSISYDKKEKYLKNNFNFNADKLIVIGKIAHEFAIKNNIKPEMTFEHNEVENINQNISLAISYLFFQNVVSEVAFILHNSRNINGEITILPLKKLNIFSNIDEKDLINSRKFFPSVIEVVDNLINLYLSNTVNAIIMEGKYFYLKEKLIKHENSINQIEEKIEIKRMEYLKTNRKIQTEELILINQNTSRLTKNKIINLNDEKNIDILGGKSD